MKSIAEIKTTPRILILREGSDGGWAEAHLASSKKSTPAMVVFSWGDGWDHVSVSFPNRTPTWEEMCEIKRMFFYPEETAWEYHPMESEYVNVHHCACISGGTATGDAFTAVLDGRGKERAIAHGRTEAGRSGADGDGAESGAAR